MIRQRGLLIGLDRLVGSALVRLLSRGTKPAAKKPAPTIYRVLIIRPGGMGDAILMIPMLRALKERFPRASVQILAERRNADVFGLIPDLVSGLFCYDRVMDLLRVLTGRYDVVMDTEQWYRLSAVAARLIRADIRCGFSTNTRGSLFNLPVAHDPERYEAENFLALLSALTDAPIPFNPERPFLTIPADPSPGLRVIMAPGASYPEKQWGPEKFRQLATGFLEQGYSVGLIGGPADVGQAAEVIQGLPVENFTGRTTLRETARVIGAAGLVIGGDSVALHLAAALGRPSIALFGPTSPHQWAPRGKNHRTLYHPPHCSPCSRFGNIPPCPYDVECLNRISVEEVQAAARQIMMTEAPGK